MEQNLPVIAKKVWSLMRVMFFMLKKGISKTKFMADLNMMMKRGKIAGKALHNLLFHHHHNWAASTTVHRHPHHHHHLSPHPPPPPADEHEFNCSDTPPYLFSLISSTHKKQQKKHHSTTTPPPAIDGGDEIIITPAVMKALEMLTSAAASPAGLPGFGKSPKVKQLRITDSPFPLYNGDEDGKVDEDAERFITRFYNDLRRQN